LDTIIDLFTYLLTYTADKAAVDWLTSYST